MTGHSAVDRLLFGDNQTTSSILKISLQVAGRSLYRIGKDFGIQISALKTKVMAFHGADPV